MGQQKCIRILDEEIGVFEIKQKRKTEQNRNGCEQFFRDAFRFLNPLGKNIITGHLYEEKS
jgi:hypothetical protein